MATDRPRPRAGPGFGRGLTGLLLCAVASCDGCCQGDLCSWPDAEEPVLSRIAPVPSEVWVAPGSAFVLGLRGWDAADNPMSVPSSGGVTWTASADLSVTALGYGSGEVEVATAPGEPLGQVTATVAGITGSASVHVSSLGEGDRVRVPASSPSGPPRAVWLRMDQSACQHDLLVSVVEEAALGQQLGPACDPTRVGILGHDRGGLMESAPLSGVAVPPWTSGVDVMTRTLLPATRSASVALRFPSVGGQATLVHEHLDLARAIFARGMTGIAFQVGSEEASPAGAHFLFSDCDDLVRLSNLNVDLTKAFLYVLYVDKIGGGERGFTCLRKATPGAVVVVAKSAAPTTLAHELGHAMGLHAPLPLWGHVTSGSTPLHGFDVTNLMWVGEHVESAVSRGAISVGQAFRMNADQRSWLVHELSLTPWSCPCNPYDRSVCPALYRDPAVAGFPDVSTAPSCTVVPP
jgi:hypothetical protein